MTEDVRVKVNPGLPWQTLHSTRRRLFSQHTGLKFEEETSKMLQLDHGFVAKTWTLRAADQKYLESFEMWCWRSIEKINL